MAYSPYFNSGYNPYYMQTPYPQPTYQAQQMQPQMTTPPTIRAEIVQVNGREEAINFPVGTGQTQIMIAKDDSAIFIKAVFANGQSRVDEYIRKQPEPDSNTPEYVTREEFERRLSTLMAANRRDKPEVSNEPTV